VSAIQLECNYLSKVYIEIDAIESLYCDAVGLVVTSPSTKIDKLAKGYFNNDLVSVIRIFKQNVNYFPSDINNYFKFVLGIDINGSNLRKLSKEDLKPFSRLKAIWIYDNVNLQTLEADLFIYNPQLTHMNFGANNLKHVDSKLFDLVKQLKSAYFKDNDCIDAEAYDEQGMKALIKGIADNCNSK